MKKNLQKYWQKPNKIIRSPNPHSPGPQHRDRVKGGRVAAVHKSQEIVKSQPSHGPVHRPLLTKDNGEDADHYRLKRWEKRKRKEFLSENESCENFEVNERVGIFHLHGWKMKMMFNILPELRWIVTLCHSQRKGRRRESFWISLQPNTANDGQKRESELLQWNLR